MRDSKIGFAAALCIYFFTACFITGGASASVLYVDDDAPAGGDGSSWNAAFRFLQDALTAARVPGSGVTEIRIGQGKYYPHRSEQNPQGVNDLRSTFSLVDGAAMLGGFAGIGAKDPNEFNPSKYITILDSRMGFNSNCCVPHPTGGCRSNECELAVCEIYSGCCLGAWSPYCVSLAKSVCDDACAPGEVRLARTMVAENLKSPVLLEGMTVIVGDPNAAFGSFYRAGAIVAANCDIVITNCIFQSTSDPSSYALRLDNGSIQITDTEFRLENTTSFLLAENIELTMDNVIVDSAGVGVACDESGIIISNCSFDCSQSAIGGENNAINVSNCIFTGWGAGAFAGNGIQGENCSIDVRDTLFYGLSADRGGAVEMLRCPYASFNNCRFERNIAHGSAAAIYYYQTPLELRNCDFIDNAAVDEFQHHASIGAVYANCTLPSLMENCRFIGNSTENWFGAMSLQGANFSIRNCSFIGNFTDPANFGAGGAMYIAASNSIVENCTFNDNFSFRGGAVVLGGATILNCEFKNNIAYDGPGGAIYSDSYAIASFVNCIFDGNIAQKGDYFKNYSYGGAVAAGPRGNLSFLNCTFASNASKQSGGAIALYSLFPNSSEPEDVNIRNCILFNNTDSTGGGEAGQIYIEPDQAGDVFITNSCVEGWSGVLGGFGNIGADPLFIDIDGPDDVPGNEDDDLRLAMNSPCIDAGDNWALPNDIFEVDGDGNIAELFPLDLDGNPRFADDPDALDTGCGANGIVDMGAYERPGNPMENVLFADLDGDGAINTNDLFILFSGWASVCDQTCCLGDLNLDGRVNVGDLFTLLSLWNN